jgi:hypothetical protein
MKSIFVSPETTEEAHLVTGHIAVACHISQQTGMQAHLLLACCCYERSKQSRDTMTDTEFAASECWPLCSIPNINASVPQWARNPNAVYMSTALRSYQHAEKIAAQPGFLPRENRLSATQRHFMQPYRLEMVVARLRVSQTRGVEGFIQMKPIKQQQPTTTKRQNVYDWHVKIGNLAFLYLY